nr:MAG TPA: hypothetical protein [Caudoviricetes sp.]
MKRLLFLFIWANRLSTAPLCFYYIRTRDICQAAGPLARGLLIGSRGNAFIEGCQQLSRRHTSSTADTVKDF